LLAAWGVLLVTALVGTGAGSIGGGQDEAVTTLDERATAVEEQPQPPELGVLGSWRRQRGRNMLLAAASPDGRQAFVSDPRLEGLRIIPLGPNSIKYLYEPVMGDVRLVSVLENLGPGYIPSLDFYNLYPVDLDRQSIVDLQFYPPTWALLQDNRGQAIVRHHFTNVRPGNRCETSWRARVVTWNLLYDIDPNDVGMLAGIPREIQAEFLADGPLFKIADPVVTAARDAALQGESNPLRMAHRLYDWVQNHMTYVAEGGWDDAVTVLQRGTGSCSEYAFAFIALCRSAGIPARWTGALVRRGASAGPGPYRDDAHHRWAEVYLPRIGWIQCEVQGGRWGYLSNAFVITSQSAGPSNLLDLRYDSYRRWTTAGGSVDTKSERYAVWYSHPDSFYPPRVGGGSKWSPQGPVQILWDVLGDTEVEGTELTLQLSHPGQIDWVAHHLNPNSKLIALPMVRLNLAGPHYAITLYRTDVPPLAGYLSGIDIANDTDSDGLNDPWELAHWGSLAPDGSADPDGDGASNRCEYYGMTAPMRLTVFASDLPPLDAVVGYGTLGQNQYGCGEMKGKIVAGGITWDKALGAHAPSRVAYEVPRGMGTFQTLYALEDHKAGEVVFQCYVNGNLVFTSPKVKKASALPSPLHLLQVSVQPGDRILLVADSYFNLANDHSCWLQPAFTADRLPGLPAFAGTPSLSSSNARRK
jgi:hypothetical protein